MTTHQPVHIMVKNNQGKSSLLTPSQHSEITGKSAVSIGIDYKAKKTNRLSNRQIAGYDPMPEKGKKVLEPTQKEKLVRSFLSRQLVPAGMV